MKIVIDSNVIIAAFATRGLCCEVFELCLAEHDIFICDAIIHEVKEALTKKVKVPQPVTKEIVDLIESRAHKVKPVELSKKICRDPKDMMILGTAESCHAGVILTGDKDLLTLKRYKNTKILTPVQFWRLLGMKG